jgi:hypothetical protein
MGLDTKTYWLTDRQSQCDFGFDFDLPSHRGDWFKYLNRGPASRRKRRRGNPVPGGITGPIPGVHKYGDLALQFEGVSNLTQ